MCVDYLLIFMILYNGLEGHFIPYDVICQRQYGVFK